MSTRNERDLCGSTHIWSDPSYTCIRPRGHDGLCWGKWQRRQRAEWLSEDGVFKRHDHYRTMRGPTVEGGAP